MFKQLLHDVVAKDIDHQSISVDHDLVKDTLSIVAIRSGDLLLQKTGPLLIAGKFDNTSKYVLED